jgi:hypothetical protein
LPEDGEFQFHRRAQSQPGQEFRPATDADGIFTGQQRPLVGITGYTTPWEKEARISLGEKLESVVLFALDQFCLMSCTVPLPRGMRSSRHMGCGAPKRD